MLAEILKKKMNSVYVFITDSFKKLFRNIFKIAYIA